MENNLVSVSNALISAKYSLNLVEKRLILLFVSMIDNKIVYETQKNVVNVGNIDVEVDKRVKIGDELEIISPLEQYEICVQDYAELWGISEKTAKLELQKAVDNLYKQSIQFKDSSGRDIETRWISSKASYDKESHSLGVMWAPNIIPYISELRKNFTSYKLRWLKNLGSIYAIRWYEYFVMELRKSKKSKILLIVYIDQIREMFVLEDKYELFADFKKWIFDYPFKDINKNTDIKVSYIDEYGKKMYIKDSRKVIGIKLNISWNK